MKKLIAILPLLVLCFYSHSQILTPVKWSYASKKINKNEAVLFVKADIDKGWHIYSQQDKGPVKTSIKFTKDNSYLPVGKTIEPTPVSKYEPLLSQTLQYFEQSVVFQQKIKLKQSQVLVKGSLHFIVCNDKHCLPPEDVNFNISIK